MPRAWNVPRQVGLTLTEEEREDLLLIKKTLLNEMFDGEYMPSNPEAACIAISAYAKILREREQET